VKSQPKADRPLDEAIPSAATSERGAIRMPSRAPRFEGLERLPSTPLLAGETEPGLLTSRVRKGLAKGEPFSFRRKGGKLSFFAKQRLILTSIVMNWPLRIAGLSFC
jgi:hypothetical protein